MLCQWRGRANDKVRSPPLYRVPNLELDLLSVDGDHARAKLDANREVVDGLEPLVGELQQQARLADAWKDHKGGKARSRGYRRATLQGRERHGRSDSFASSAFSRPLRARSALPPFAPPYPCRR